MEREVDAEFAELVALRTHFQPFCSGYCGLLLFTLILKISHLMSCQYDEGMRDLNILGCGLLASTHMTMGCFWMSRQSRLYFCCRRHFIQIIGLGPMHLPSPTCPACERDPTNVQMIKIVTLLYEVLNYIANKQKKLLLICPAPFDPRERRPAC